MDHDEMKELFIAAYDTHASAIFRYCRLKVSSHEVAEDVTQETFARYWQQLRLGKDVANEKALLYRIARNLVIDWYRKKKEHSLDTLTDAGLEFADGAHVDIEHKAEFNAVIKTINTLDEQTREALLLRFVEGLSPREIAEITGETPNVISVRINRGITKVRDRLNI